MLITPGGTYVELLFKASNINVKRFAFTAKGGVVSSPTMEIMRK